MQDLLSQDEIDALLHGVDDGDVDTSGDTSPGGVSSYDLTTQDRIVRGRMPTLEMIQHSIYMTVLIAGLMILLSSSTTIELIIYWSALAMIVRIPFTVYRYRLLQKNVKIKLERNSIFKYLITSIIVFSIVFFITDEFLVYNERIFEFLPNFLFFVVIGIGAYLTSTYFIDQRTKKLVHAILKEVKKK